MNTYKTKPLEPINIEEAITDFSYFGPIAEILEDGTKTYHYIWKNLIVDIFGISVTISGSTLENIRHSPLQLTTEEAQHLKRNSVNQKYIELEFKERKSKREKFTTAVIALEEQLRYACAEDKSDINYINELDGLLICEAEPFLTKLKERIEKRSSAKALKQYKRLMEYKKETPIECSI